MSLINLTSRAIMNIARIPALADSNVMNTFQIRAPAFCYFIERFFVQKVYHVNAPLRYALSHCPSYYDVLHGWFFHGKRDVAPEAF